MCEECVCDGSPLPSTFLGFNYEAKSSRESDLNPPQQWFGIGIETSYRYSFIVVIFEKMADPGEELNLNLPPSPPHSFPLSLSLQLNPSSSEDITIEAPHQNEADLRRRRRYGRRATPNRIGNEDIRVVILRSIDRQLEQASVSPEKASDEVSSPLPSAKDFECNICLDMARDPVVTACGHLFCWPCLYQWIYLHSDVRECPVCKGDVRDIDIIPIYGRGNVDTEAEAEAEAEAEGKCPSDHRNPKIPKRPHAHRVESSRIEGFRRSRRRSIPAWLDADDMVEYGGEHGNASQGRGEDGYFRFGRGTMEVRNRLRALRDVLENNRRNSEDSARQAATEDDRRVRQRIMGGRRRLFESQSRANRAPHIGEGEDDDDGRMTLGFESTLAREREEMSRHLAFLRRHVRAERSPSRDSRSRTTPRHLVADEDERIPLGLRASLSRDQEEMSRHLALLRRHVRSEWSSQLEPRRRTTSPLMLDVEGLESFAAPAREHNEMSEHPISLHQNIEAERASFLGSISATAPQSVVQEVEETVPPRFISSVIREQDEFSRSLPSTVNIRAARSLPLAPRISRTTSHIMLEGVEERTPSGLETSLAREHEAMSRHLAFLRHIRADRFPSLESRAVIGPHLVANEVEERTPLGLETSVARVQEELSRRLAFLQQIRTDRAPLLESRTSTSPIVVDEVEERMAIRLETSLAREQEEILRNLALIRHIRADRLAAIRARLASMEGMLETLVGADHQSEHTRSSGPVQLATNIHQDFLPDVQEEESGEVSV